MAAHRTDRCKVLKFGTLIWNGLLIIVSKVSCRSLKLYSATKASKLEVRLRPQLLNRETIFLNWGILGFLGCRRFDWTLWRHCRHDGFSVICILRNDNFFKLLLGRCSDFHGNCNRSSSDHADKKLSKCYRWVKPFTNNAQTILTKRTPKRTWGLDSVTVYSIESKLWKCHHENVI